MTAGLPAGSRGPDTHSETGEAAPGHEKEPVMAWRLLSPGDVVSVEVAKSGQQITGSVDARTGDGLIIWIRDELNDRKAYHFEDCLSVQLLG